MPFSIFPIFPLFSSRLTLPSWSERTRRGAWTVAISVAAALPVQAADLTVLVDNIQHDAGQVMLGVFDSAAGFPKTMVKGVMAMAKERDASGRVRLVVTGLVPGQYALSAFHDLDGNGKLNANMMGLPTEPYGFSNAARGTFGPPSFKDAAVSLGEQALTVQIRVE
jgi:uncharacterized protein (DUF2141 family)